MDEHWTGGSDKNHPIDYYSSLIKYKLTLYMRKLTCGFIPLMDFLNIHTILVLLSLISTMLFIVEE